jgi:anti-anti-sigma factor
VPRAYPHPVIRITVKETNDIVCLMVEGKLSGAWVPELENVVADMVDQRDSGAVEIDLSGISGMDAAGRSLLVRLRMDGVRLRNLDPLSESLLTMEVAA